MKAQCEKCREIVELDFAIADRGIDVHCGACAQVYFISATRVAGGLAKDQSGSSTRAGESTSASTSGASPSARTAGKGASTSGASTSGASPSARTAGESTSGASPSASTSGANTSGESADDRIHQRPPGDPDRRRCPKCGEIQPPTDACRKCGLVWEKWAGVEREQEPASAELLELWEACKRDWDVPTRHDAFLSFCQRLGSYSFAASSYRGALAERGATDPIASERLKQVRSLAELALLKPSKLVSDDAKMPYRGTLIILAVTVAILIGGIAYVFLFPTGGGQEQQSSPMPAATKIGTGQR